MKVLTRYLLRAHVGPFLFALVALTGVILINTLAKELANLAGKGLPFEVVFEFFVLSLPANLALTMPMAVLVSVLYTFSTLASENEITALRASGVDLRRAALPLIVLAALITGGMVWFNDRVLPAANYRWRVLMTDVAQTSPLLALRSQTLNQIRTNDNVTRYYLEARGYEAETGGMTGVRIYDIGGGGVTRIITADSGRVAFNSARTDLILTLFAGDIWEVDFADPSTFRIVDFESQVMRMPGVGDEFQRSYGSEYRTDRDMTIGMMRERIDSLTAQIAELRARPPAIPGAAPVGEVTPADPAAADSADPAEPAAASPAPAATDGTPSRPPSSRDAGGSGPNGESGMIDAAPTALGEGIALAAGAVARGAAAADGSDAAATADTLGRDTSASTAPAAHGSAAADSAADGRAVAPPADAPPLDRFTQSRINNLEYQIREYRLEIQKKFTIAFATLVFVLIGIPLALRFPRGGIGMVSAFSLAIFGIYYVGLIGGEELSDRGYVPVLVATWTTNVVFGILGLIGFLRLGKEQGSGRGAGWGDLPNWMRRLRLPTRSKEAGA